MNRTAAFLLCGLVLPVGLVAQTSMQAAKSKPPKPNVAAPKAWETITFTDYAFDAPAEVPAGLITFHAVNHGKELHHGSLVRLDSNHTVADLMAVMKHPGPVPAWARFVGGPQAASTVTMDLAAGNYVWLCLIPGQDGLPHMAKGMVRPMKVVPSHGGSAAPKADIVVSMSDYTWALSKPITRGPHVLRVADDPKAQPHELVIVHLAAGKTAQDVLNWVEHPNGPPPAERVEGITTMEPGLTMYTNVDFTPGRYAMICFVPDSKDGKPHALHGMVKEFTVE